MKCQDIAHRRIPARQILVIEKRLKQKTHPHRLSLQQSRLTFSPFYIWKRGQRQCRSSQSCSQEIKTWGPCSTVHEEKPIQPTLANLKVHALAGIINGFDDILTLLCAWRRYRKMLKNISVGLAAFLIAGSVWAQKNAIPYPRQCFQLPSTRRR